MITIQIRFAVCVQTALSLRLVMQAGGAAELRALRCVEESCRVPSRYYRDLDVAAEAQAFVDYWLRGAKPKERPAWLTRWMKDRRPES